MGFLDKAKDIRAQNKAKQPTATETLQGFGRVLRSQGLAGGMSPLAIRREAKQVAAERPSRRNGWFTRYDHGTTQVMLDKNGKLTSSYPHVHVIHDEPRNEVRIVLSRSQTDHPEQDRLPGSASGNEVNAAVDRMLRKL